MSNYAPMETDLNGRHSPPGAYAVAPPAPHIALPKRPAKLGSSGRPITLVANHFFVDVRRMVELSLYDVTITPPAAPVRARPRASAATALHAYCIVYVCVCMHAGCMRTRAH